MKKMLFLFIFLSTLTKAQVPFELWGAANKGGAGNGSIFKADPIAGNYKSVHNFSPNSSYWPKSVLKHPNGKIYGVTSQGGAYSGGALFEYDTATNIYKELMNSKDSTGFPVIGPLFLASNNKIYGTSTTALYPYDGMLFEYNVITNTYTGLHNFHSAWSGLKPTKTFMTEVGGKLYGISDEGGTWSEGGIFELDLATGIYTHKLSFIINGASSGFINGQNGKLYARFNYSDILEYDIALNTYQIIVPVNSSILLSGASGGFNFGDSTKLMGCAIDGGVTGNGYIYTYNFSSNAYTINVDLPSFAKQTLKLMSAGSNKFYALTGGPTNIYEYDSVTNVVNLLKSFSGSEGIAGFNEFDISLAPDGNLYGCAMQGGIFSNGGTLFSFDTSTNTYTKLHDFKELTDGSNPLMFLTPMSNDVLIGQTWQGMIYTVDINSGVFTKKLDISLGGGVTLTRTTGGKYYTLSISGGAFGDGAILCYDSTSNTVNTLQNFSSSTSGRQPMAPLTLAADGMLYSTAFYGGSTYNGTIYKYDPVTNTLTGIHSFTGTDGNFPSGGVIQASNGKLYGTTHAGGATGHGVIYEFDISTLTLVVLHHFNFTDGTFSTSGLTEVSPGIFYGLCSEGGANNEGCIFKMDVNLNAFTLLFSFSSSTSGKKPRGTLLYKNGLLYGETSEGGSAFGGGTMFSFDPTTSIFTKMFAFYPPNGFLTTIDPIYLGRMQTGLVAVCSGINITSINIPSSVCEGSDMNMQITTSGDSLNFTWYKNGSPIAGSDTSDFTLTNMNFTDTGNYYCSITNGCRTVISDTFNVSVFPNTLTVSATLTNPSICEGEKTMLIASSSFSGSTYSVLPAQTLGTLFLSANSQSYIVTAIDTAGCIAKDTANLTVNACGEVWPGDANVQGVVDMNDLFTVGVKYGQTGPARTAIDNIWIGHAASLWSDTLLSGFNTTHADCNGDGIVDFNDTLAISLNYGLTRSEITYRSPSDSGDINIIIQGITYLPGDTVKANIYAGSSWKPLDTIYGLAFSLEYPDALIQPGTFNLNFIDSWLGNAATDLLIMNKSMPGDVAIGMTRKDHVDKSGYGQIATASFVLQSIPTNDSLFVVASGATACDHLGNIFDLTASGSFAISTQTSKYHKEIFTKMYPNPSKKENVRIECSEYITAIQISDLTGKTVLYTRISPIHTTIIDTKTLLTGAYLVKVETEKGKSFKKLIITN